MLAEERNAVARLAYEAMSRRNLALIADHPGYWESRQVFPALFAAFPDLSAIVEQQTVDGEWVTTRATIRGTQREAFLGIPPTGKAVEVMHIALDQVVEGKVVEHFAVTDWLRALVAFGVVSRPTATVSAARG